MRAFQKEFWMNNDSVVKFNYNFGKFEQKNLLFGYQITFTTIKRSVITRAMGGQTQFKPNKTDNFTNDFHD